MKSIFSKETFTYKKKLVFNAGVESTLAYLNEETNFAPTIQLLFSPFGLPFVPLEILGTDMNKIIRSLQWSKDRNNPGGMCTIEFTPDSEMIKKIVRTIDKFSGNLYSRIWGGLGVEIEDLLKPMTYCQLWIDGYHVFSGNVRGCTRNSGVSGKDKDISYTLTVDELGNIYNLNTLSLDTVVKDAMAKNVTDAIYKAMESVSEVKFIPVSAGIKLLLQAFTSTLLLERVRTSDGIPLSVRLRADNNPLGGIANASFISAITTDTSLFQLNSSGGGQQSFWDFLKNFIPSPWMEFYTESGGRTIVTEGGLSPLPSVLVPGANYVVARSAPYSNPLLGIPSPSLYRETFLYELNALKMIAGGDFVIITDKMIQNKSLGFDSSNQSTIFHTYYSNKGGSGGTINATSRGIKATGPLNPFASGGIPTFGIREMFQTIECTSLLARGVTDSLAERIAKKISGLPGQIISENALASLLAVWFRNQSRFREGSVTVKGMPWARAGMYCLYLPTHGSGFVENVRDIGMYYIDSVSHNYELGDKSVDFTTTLSLIRGTPMPMSVAQTALLLFDWEILPPMSGAYDGEYTIQKLIREAARGGK